MFLLQQSMAHFCHLIDIAVLLPVYPEHRGKGRLVLINVEQWVT